MTEGWLFVLVAGAWLTIGLVLALVMGRRGYAAWSWLVMGALLGPFAVALAINGARHRQSKSYTVTAGAPGRNGPIDVLVGIDGSPEADAAAVGTTGILGTRLGRMTLAAVVPYDSGRETEEEARANLRRVAARFPEGSVETEILSGPAANELVHHARERGYDLLAIGVRGKGRSKAVLGSAASRLARGSKVPVLMFGGDAT